MISKLEECLSMKFCHTVWSITWALSTKVTRDTEMRMKTSRTTRRKKKRRTRRRRNHKKNRNQTQKAKQKKALLLQTSPNAKINDVYCKQIAYLSV